MSFTNSPSQSTYSTEKVDIVKQIVTRSGTTFFKDEDYLNVFIEVVKNKEAEDSRKFVVKRAGSTQEIPAFASSSIRGFIYWTDQNKLVYCVGKNIYSYDFGTQLTAPYLNIFTTTSGDVGFIEYLYDDGTSDLIVVDGTNLVQISSTFTFTTCTDADLPVPHQPYPVFLDGYVFLVKSGTADIYGSDANNPLSWDSSNFITAELEADELKRIAKINNYLIAFGSETIEYFWDAGVATGSPLQRNDTPIKNVTYITGFAKEANNVFFIGRDASDGIQVYKMMDFKADPISTPAISRYLNELGTDYTQWTGSIISYQGHTFYVVNAGLRTYCYDLSNGLWVKLGYQGGTNFPIYLSCSITNSVAFKCIFNIRGTDTWYRFDETLYQDSGTNFNCIIVTDNNDFGNLKRKTMAKLSIYGDRPPTDSNLLIQWSDDDYQTYNVGVNTNLNQDSACIYRLGSFRQRCFRFTHSDNTLLRLMGLEADINKGNS